jgi:monothiol glutaredoxin
MADSILTEIQKEIAENVILVYGKGTKEMPRCGFTLETIEFFNRFGHEFTIIDVLDNMPKREALSQMTNWQTLPKVFIGGTFYGDTDILEPMDESGELATVLKTAFGGKDPAPADGAVIKLH